MGECRGKGQSVEHLGHACSCLVSLLLVSPVTGSQRVAKAIGNGLGLNGQLQIEVLEDTCSVGKSEWALIRKQTVLTYSSLINEPLSIQLDLFCEIAK